MPWTLNTSERDSIISVIIHSFLLHTFTKYCAAAVNMLVTVEGRVKVHVRACVCHLGNPISTDREPSLSCRETPEPRRFRQPALLHLFISVCFHSTLGNAKENSTKNKKTTNFCLPK